MTDRRYKGVSLEAKVLYGQLLDRMGLSARNGWLDDNGRVFLCFTQEEAMAMLDCGKDKATKLFRELILENIEYDILLQGPLRQGLAGRLCGVNDGGLLLHTGICPYLRAILHIACSAVYTASDFSCNLSVPSGKNSAKIITAVLFIYE